MNKHPVLKQVGEEDERETLGDGVAHDKAELEGVELGLVPFRLVGVLDVDSLVELVCCEGIIQDEHDGHDDQRERRLEFFHNPPDCPSDEREYQFRYAVHTFTLKM